MGRIYGLLRYSLISIIIPGVFLLYHSREASATDHWGTFNPQEMAFAGLISSSIDRGEILIAQSEDDAADQETDSAQEQAEDELSEDDFLDEDFPEDFSEDDFPEDDLPLDESAGIRDPLEPVNRAFFVFNDKLYFWVLRPVAKGYSYVAPETVRVGISNFFYNLAFPVRFVNCVLQGKVQGASEEISRFVINTTVGMAGFIDVATNKVEIPKNEEDLGQTFGVWGLGPAFYINWPILGPSTLRDTFGFVGDAFLDPIAFIIDPTEVTLALNVFDIINQTSLRIGDYEDLKKAAFDPYIALRDAYYQNRISKIEE